MEYNIEKRIIDIAIELRDASVISSKKIQEFQKKNPSQEEMESEIPKILESSQEKASKLFQLLDEYEFINGVSKKINE